MTTPNRGNKTAFIKKTLGNYNCSNPILDICHWIDRLPFPFSEGGKET